MKLFGKVALVTGGSRGIGKEVCTAFAAEGARVIVNYANSTKDAEEVVDRIRETGGEAFAYRCDVANEAEVTAMMAEASRIWGGVDIVVNNAAAYPRKVWHEITSEEWDRVMAVNVKSCFLTSKAAFPYMQAKGAGKIINVTSVTFFSGQTQFLHYVSSKGGIIGFTRALAREVGIHSIQVNAISPGAIMTEQELNDVPDEKDRRELTDYLAKVQCLPRRGLPSDLAGSFIFLASTDSDFMTGQTVNVDGGWIMH